MTTLGHFVRLEVVPRIDAGGDLREVRRWFEAEVVAAIIERTGGNVVRAAAILGLHRNRVYDKLREMEKLGVACTRKVKAKQPKRPGRGIWQG